MEKLEARSKEAAGFAKASSLKKIVLQLLTSHASGPLSVYGTE
jgi:hypothetical protein